MEHLKKLPAVDGADAHYRINRTIAICLLVLTGMATLVALQLGKPFLAPTVVALLIALTLSPMARWLEARGFGREISAALVVVGVLVALAVGAYALIPSYEVWRVRLPEIVGALRERFEEVGEQLQPVSETAEAVKEVAEDASGQSDSEAGAESSAPPAVPAPSNLMLQWLSETPVIAARLIYVVLLVFFIIAERGRLHRGMLMLLQTGRRRRHLARALRDMRRNVSRYLLLITIINIGLGFTAFAVFLLLGVPNAGLWGAAVALLNFVPYLGAALMTGVMTIVGLVSFDSVEYALLPAGGLILLNLIEGQIVTPMIVGRNVLQSSLAVFLAVAFGAWLWGAIGALLATPALIVGWIFFERFQLLPERRAPEWRVAQRSRRSA